MKFSSQQTLASIAKIINATFEGPEDFPVLGLNEIHRVEPGEIVFVDHPKYYDKALKSKATIILINKKVECPADKALLFSVDPFRDFNRLITHFHPAPPVHNKSLIIPASSSVGKNCRIYPGVVIGENVSIGNDCILYPNVVIYDDCILGNNVIIHANTVIGSEAFYYKKRPEGFDKLLTCGRAIVEDHVEIGASSTIDKGVSADTIIGYGTKIDNMVHVGHDTIVGKHCLFAAGVAIAGVVTIEDHVTLWGQVGIASDITIKKGAVVWAQSGVGKDIQEGKTYFGSPAEEAHKKLKELAALRQLAGKNS